MLHYKLHTITCILTEWITNLAPGGPAGPGGPRGRIAPAPDGGPFIPPGGPSE